jgi:hypothetical protein
MRLSFFYPFSKVPSIYSKFCKAAMIGVPLLVMTWGAQVNAFEPPPKSGAPRGTSGGGTRPVSQCLKRDVTSLQTLTPPTGVGYTENQNPMFWVYLPPHQAIELEFTLQSIDPSTTQPNATQPNATDNNDMNKESGSYQVLIPAPQGSGWTSLALPDVPALKAQQLYRWSVALVCNPSDRPSNDAVVRGNLIYQPKSASVLDQIGKIQADYWLDAMSKMSENNRLTWIKSHKILDQGTVEGRVNQPIADESWQALLLQSRMLTQSRSHQTLVDL